MSIERVPEPELTIAQLIDRQRTQIARALPAHMDADRLARIATTVIKTTPRLMECSAPSLLGALMLSAQTGLEPGPLGHVYFVPRRNKGVWECQWQLGYRGMIELARRSGNLRSIEAREVCEHDRFTFRYGLDERLEHEPKMDGDRGAIVAFWGLAKFNDGGHYFLVMSRSDIDAARARSSAGQSGPWVTDYAAMGRKTVIRRMMPFLPVASEQAAVLARDEGVTRIGVGQQITADLAADAAPPIFIDAEVADDRVTLAEVEAAQAETPAPEPQAEPQPDPEPEPVPDEPPVDDDTAGILRARIKAAQTAGTWPDLSKLLKAEKIPLNVSRMTVTQGARALELVPEVES